MTLIGLHDITQNRDRIIKAGKTSDADELDADEFGDGGPTCKN